MRLEPRTIAAMRLLRYRVLVPVLLALAVAIVAGRWWLVVDTCYDAGGVYLDEIQKCSHSQAEVDRYRPRKP